MQPFEFKTEFHLVKLPGISVSNIKELYKGITVVPSASILSYS